MTKKKLSLVDRFLTIVEKVGNFLPHPATLFAGLAVLTIILSAIFANMGIESVKPGTGEVIAPFNLLTAEGLQKITMGMVKNFSGFAPLGTVLVALLGIGIAEGSGLIAAVIRGIVQNSNKVLNAMVLLIAAVATIALEPVWQKILIPILGIALIFFINNLNKRRPDIILTFIIVFSGILSNTASEVGYVLLVPLGAIMFLGAKRHPIAGMAAAFAGVSGGYSANLLIGTIDPLLAGISTEAAKIVAPAYEVSTLANLNFMMASVIFIAIAGTWVTHAIVEPRLGKYKGSDDMSSDDEEKIKDLSKNEKRGIIYASVAGIVFLLLLALTIIPESGPLRLLELPKGISSFADMEYTAVIKPFLKSVVAFIFLGAAFLGIAYGVGAKTFRSDEDVMNGMAESMKTLGSYIVLVFFAAQFIAYFNWTNLGLILAIEGANFLQALDMGTIPLLIAFIILAALINLVMGSASAKWTIMAPVFIPMFMYLGMSPELTQGAYRVGDSVTNIISPMMSYFALIIAFVQRYDKKAGIGTVVATMVPYSIIFFLIWTTLFIIWFSFGWPLGPESPMIFDPSNLGS
ncbi:AbgT family transporter [Candidatus Kapabacteria bacterium]|nr:AbgT family transporter [Candidatus Kapabacteria bacterium]